MNNGFGLASTFSVKLKLQITIAFYNDVSKRDALYMGYRKRSVIGRQPHQANSLLFGHD